MLDHAVRCPAWSLLWPIILVICGLLLIWRFARKS